MQDDFEALDRFMITLEWLMALHERNPHALTFGLIHVCFHDQESLGKAYGARDASNMLSELARQLRQNFRKTDLVARNGTDIWVLVPYTQPETVTEKIGKLVELASDKGLNIVDRDVAVFALPDPEVLHDLKCKTASEFLIHLKQNRQIAIHWAPVFRPA